MAAAAAAAAATPMSLSAAQREAFESQGVVLVPDVLTHAELADAKATWCVHAPLPLHAGTVRPWLQGDDSAVPCRDRLAGRREKMAAYAGDAGFVALVSHPFFEAAAKQLLRSDSVHLAELNIHDRKPSGTEPADEAGRRAAWSNGCHIDLQITTADWNATPRRDLLAIWYWVDDVPAERGAMRILPRSHLSVNAHWDRVLTAEQKKQLPRQHGLFPHPSTAYPSYPEHIPEPPGFAYSECEPMPVAVPANTAQIFTQSMLHSSWENTDTVSRKAFVISWCDTTVPIGWDSVAQLDTRREMYPKLRASIARLQPGREHVVQDQNHFVSSYEPHWETTFLPGKTAADAHATPRQRL
eukprot:SAG22_NODE_54_length_23787_cov_12.917511_5_plen_355_part_00